MRESMTAVLTIAACVTYASGAFAQQPQPTQQGSGATTTTNTAPATPTASTPVTTSAIVPSGTQTSLDLPAPETTSSPINRPLMVTGVLMLGGTYAASAIDASVSNRDADKNNLYYPIVGPWMDYANRGCDARPCANETGNKVLLILDGVGQGLGAIGIVTSLFIPEKTTRNWYLIGGSGLHAAPSRVGTGYGLGAGGVF